MQDALQVECQRFARNGAQSQLIPGSTRLRIAGELLEGP
ncbi:hypothetical protein A471_00075 [Ectopseudomonas mendocina DLHK]|nr:hypothetical protein A471_00075 [Pseudomonas mendocina DLHK]